MTKVKVRGEEYEIHFAKDSFSRRSVQCQNKILTSLKKLGVTEDQADIPLEPLAIKKAPASVSWFFDGHHFFFSFQGNSRFIDNLYTVFAVVDAKIEELLNEKIEFDDFMSYFKEEVDVKDERKVARETLGLHEDTTDIEAINKRYKELAKEHHPDTDNGDIEKFKAINKAHKILKRELE